MIWHCQLKKLILNQFLKYQSCKNVFKGFEQVAWDGSLFLVAAVTVIY